MAIPIKAIPTLYGEEARRMTAIIEENERRFEMAPKVDRKSHPDYIMMRKIVEKSKRMNTLLNK